MNDDRGPPRRGRGPSPYNPDSAEQAGEDNPYREAPPVADGISPPAPVESAPRAPDAPPIGGEAPALPAAVAPASVGDGQFTAPPSAPPREPRAPREPRGPHEQNGRRGRRNRGRGRQQGGGPVGDRPQQGGSPPAPMQLVPTGETKGWFDPARDGGFIRRPQASY